MLKKQTNTVDHNERITAIAGAILFVLIIAELCVTASLRGLRTEHIFVGILLSGPLVIKMGSTGYRFFRYYTKSSEYVRKGPPNIVLRFLAPLLVLSTVLVFISGYGLVFGHHEHLYGTLHAGSVAVWIPLVAFHAYAYIKKVPALISADWKKKVKNSTSGRYTRLLLNILGIVGGVVAGVMLLPQYTTGYGHVHLDLPGPLIAGLIAAIVAVFAVKPILKYVNRWKQVE